MENSREIERQAVIIVHGMGEQRPMETLRSFVVKSEVEKSNVDEKRAVLRSQPVFLQNYSGAIFYYIFHPFKNQ
jgi:hypothetical protein